MTQKTHDEASGNERPDKQPTNLDRCLERAEPTTSPAPPPSEDHAWSRTKRKVEDEDFPWFLRAQ